MSQETEEGIRVPEYQIDQYFPEEPELSRDARAQLRSRHGFVRTYFITHPGPFRELQRWLNQGRFGLTYDEYMARTAWYTIAATFVGAVLGIILTSELAASGILSGLSAPVEVSRGLERLVVNNRLVVVGTALTLTGAVLVGLGTWAGRFYYPRFVANSRARSINIGLPHAIVYMYALSNGGRTTYEVLKRTAESEEIYGEVAREFDSVVRDVEVFGTDLFSALRDQRNLTVSESMEQFLDDLISVLDSGSDVSAFLENEAETYMDEARAEQDEFLDTLSVLSEIFVVAFVAAPLFMIVTFVVISLLGGRSLGPTIFLVYVVLPAGMAGFLLVIDLLSQPYAQTSGDPEADADDTQDGFMALFDKPDASVREMPGFAAYWSRHRIDVVRDAVEAPWHYFSQEKPAHSLVFTAPVAVLVPLVLILDGRVTPTISAIAEAPVATTTGLFLLPFLIVAIPLSMFYELKQRRDRHVARRLPEVLNILSSANEMGIRLTEGLALVSRWSEGTLASEFGKVRNDIRWDYDIHGALLRLAGRLKVPQVTRTMNLIAEGAQSNSDLANVIGIAVDDTRNRYQIDRRRRRAMGAYTTIVLIGFLVYLSVIVMLSVGYLNPIAEMAATTSADGAAQSGPLLNVVDVPVDLYRTVFFHSALIQGVGSGLLAGKLADNDALGGLKYGIVLVLLTMVVFAFV